jgi:hypothetical protein
MICLSNEPNSGITHGDGMLAELQAIAESRGGQCLATEFCGSRKPLKFACGKGHEWQAVAHSIRRGTWCPVCAGRVEKTLSDAMRLAESRSGQCLALELNGVMAKVLWQCVRGHQWRAAYNNISSGSWCPKCARGSLTFAELQSVAASKGGAILSPTTDYKNGQSLLRMRCVEGHGWEMRAGPLGKGNWCRQCAANKIRVPIEVIQRYAESRGGRLLTEKLSTRKGKSWVYFECAKGHGWRGVGNAVVKSKSWCRTCRYEGERHTIEEMRTLAEAKGGECLSKEYKTAISKLQWRCAAGHLWQTTPAIVMGGTWCVKCTSPTVNSLEKLDELARERGGRVLSRRYVNSVTKMEFVCKRGHRWNAVPASVADGKWCRKCSGSAKSTIENMCDLARDRGGVCLSELYKDNKTKLLWRCKRDHEFWMKPDHIVARGSWCPTCRGKKSASLDDLRARAVARGGRCLSETFKRNSDHISLECGLGHRWSPTASGFLRGAWCSLCARARNAALRKGKSRHGQLAGSIACGISGECSADIDMPVESLNG